MVHSFIRVFFANSICERSEVAFSRQPERREQSLSSTLASSTASLRVPGFRAVLVTRLLITLAFQIQFAVMTWQMYEHTKSALALGYVGLAEAIPFILVSLVSGYIADRFNRKRVFFFALLLALSASFALFFYSATTPIPDATFFYSVIGVIGFARGFMGPTLGALWGEFMPAELYTNAATWNNNIFNFGAVAGPVIGGVLFQFTSAEFTYGFACLLLIGATVAISMVTYQKKSTSMVGESLKEKLTAGIRFVFNQEVLVSAMTLDLFAVLFGGAVALLPAFAQDVFHCTKAEYGWLRAATFVGSFSMGLLMTRYAPVRKTGLKLLWSVAGFGFCMIGFALSGSWEIAFIWLALSGAFDNVSMVIRGSIVQILTPNEMRGRVSAVSGVFIGSSNEIGAFESGVAAKLLGLVPSVVVGGIITQLVVVATALKFKGLTTFEIEPREGALTSKN